MLAHNREINRHPAGLIYNIKGVVIMDGIVNLFALTLWAGMFFVLATNAGGVANLIGSILSGWKGIISASEGK